MAYASLLHRSCAQGRVDDAMRCLDRGDDVDLLHKGYAPLIFASANGMVDTARLCLDRGAVVDRAAEVNGWTPLHISCFNGYVEVARLLLERGQILIGRSQPAVRHKSSPFCKTTQPWQPGWDASSARGAGRAIWRNRGTPWYFAGARRSRAGATGARVSRQGAAAGLSLPRRPGPTASEQATAATHAPAGRPVPAHCPFLLVRRIGIYQLDRFVNTNAPHVCTRSEGSGAESAWTLSVG